jgi:hypothetical protein
MRAARIDQGLVAGGTEGVHELAEVNGVHQAITVQVTSATSGGADVGTDL